MIGHFYLLKTRLQQGSEFRTFEIRTHSKSGRFRLPIFKWFECYHQPRSFYIYIKKKFIQYKTTQASVPFKNGRFCLVFEWSISLDRFLYMKYFLFIEKTVQATGLAAILFLDHSKTGPFHNRTHVDHSKTGHVRYSDPHCILVFGFFLYSDL